MPGAPSNVPAPIVVRPGESGLMKSPVFLLLKSFSRPNPLMLRTPIHRRVRLIRRHQSSLLDWFRVTDLFHVQEHSDLLLGSTSGAKVLSPPLQVTSAGFAEAWSEAARNLGPAVGILSAAAEPRRRRGPKGRRRSRASSESRCNWNKCIASFVTSALLVVARRSSTISSTFISTFRAATFKCSDAHRVPRARTRSYGGVGTRIRTTGHGVWGFSPFPIGLLRDQERAVS